MVDPGPGSDFVLAGDGDDTISVRDGFGDVVECGPGTDTVTADRADVLSGCENVALPPPDTSRIDGPTKVTKGTKAFFTFVASVASATFECQVDTGTYKLARPSQAPRRSDPPTSSARSTSSVGVVMKAS